MSLLSLENHADENVARVALSGELDISCALLFEEALRRAEESGAPDVVLDLRELRFLDSTGLHLILSAHSRLARRKRRLTIVEGEPPVRRIFSLAGVRGRLRLVNDIAATRAV